MRAKGNEGEELAANTLKQKGFSVLERNVRFSVGEIDIIAQKGTSLYFFEVKFRGQHALAGAIEVITHHQMKRIRRAASLYLMKYEKKKGEIPMAFLGVVAIDGQGNVEIIEDAFE
ncbi:MAG: hypothetical protein A3I05_04620 [Deltaproteobacteria bacterium RIFCSPLOWO2_02_FULL_44_10]|nr:MAG: hypothetical protein A3C46_07425 [Deltaproteobacteria bacterium RIFCSPHIGHO2_02_FULL_44_16]OGQ46640.1 MAG: hypothetical protein A3I05_04620 [Deltaproteobacteria bacterium RIFCSPLOWO2_02_FULL_44_10]